MTKKIKVFIIFIIVLLIIFLLLNDNHRVKGSQREKVETKEKIAAVLLPSDHSESNEEELLVNEKPELILKSKQNKVQNSYLDLYEKLILARDCKIVFKTKNDFDRNIDPYTRFKNSISNQSNGRQIEAKTIQIQALSDFLTECKDLQNEVEFLIEKNNYKTKFNFSHPVINYSIKRFHEATPKTEEEIELANILSKTGKLGNIQMNFGSLVNGKSVLSKAERKEVENEIKELRKLMYPKNNGQPVSQQEYQNRKQQREELQKAIDQKYQYLKESRYIDKEKLQRFRDAYAHLYPEIFKLLKTKYAYVFIEVYREISMSLDHGKKPFNYERNIKFFRNLNPDYLTMSNIVFKESGFKYMPYFNQIYTPSKNLFLCYLGLDCSSTSRIVRNYCLGMNDYPIYYEACGQDLQTFYYDTLLSHNQIRDVNVVFDYMVNEYAQ